MRHFARGTRGRIAARVALLLGITIVAAGGVFAWRTSRVLKDLSNSFPRVQGLVRDAPVGSVVLIGNDTVAVIHTVGGFRLDTLVPDSTMLFVAQSRSSLGKMRQDTTLIGILKPVTNWQQPISIQVSHPEHIDRANHVGYLVLEPDQIRLVVYVERL